VLPVRAVKLKETYTCLLSTFSHRRKWPSSDDRERKMVGLNCIWPRVGHIIMIFFVSGSVYHVLILNCYWSQVLQV
jgi:hypothetical protein